MKPPATRRLGRGLSALIPTDDPNPSSRDGASAPPSGPMTVSVGQILATTQPRTQFAEVPLRELADSIQVNGILQPILVRHASEPDRYVIIAGERRFRAAQLAGLTSVPVLVREATEAQAYELALVENIQREDLDPIEEAQAYQHLAQTYELTQEQIARRVGKSRVAVTNSMRLLKLPTPVQALMLTGELSAGHARALLQAPDDDERIRLAHAAVDEGWTVRDTEKAARAAKTQPAPVADEDLAVDGDGAPTAEPVRSPDDAALEDRLRTALGAPLSFRRKGDRGRIEIRFHSRAELDRLVDLLLSLEGK
ncbi:MAG: ParB/RepB/Spo0J family partition protein [Myxococcales bacterium]|nr:ParB/RepB/Spo0J family partition protein [Myxococcales bacterium]MCB9526748.1 ParB/RepB/Spo0J family partition protein [Myxococcales bacterium]